MVTAPLLTSFVEQARNNFSHRFAQLSLRTLRIEEELVGRNSRLRFLHKRHQDLADELARRIGYVADAVSDPSGNADMAWDMTLLDGGCGPILTSFYLSKLNKVLSRISELESQVRQLEHDRRLAVREQFRLVDEITVATHVLRDISTGTYTADAFEDATGNADMAWDVSE